MRTLLLISLLSLIGVIKCRPQQSSGLSDISVQTQLRTEAERKNGAIRETVAMVAKQLTESNITDFARDTRTPPKIKIMHRNTKKPAKAEIEEVSHPGVAEPIDVDKFMETTIKTEPKTTTDSGLSTWILLSGNSPTTKAPRRNSVKPTALPMATVKFVEKTTKIAPKPKVTTTRRPPTTSTTTKKPTTKVDTTPVVMETKPTKMMTKIKASVLTNALHNKTKATTPLQPKTTTITTTQASTTEKISTTTEEDLKPEAKIVDLELLESRVSTKKPPKRPNNSNNNNNANANKDKKKNKNRRRKPQEQKTKTNATKLATKEKPIATQFYNYLSREVMPTVGVGLVGLVVTAGLASYFLFPFTGLRRNYEGALDRKDDLPFDNYFSDGEMEQDVIGKMIEGGYEYNTMSNSVYQPYNRYNDYKYDDRITAERPKVSGYTADDRKYNKFSVGNPPDSFVPVTPAVVPEHGPRNFPKEEKVDSSETKVIVGKSQDSLVTVGSALRIESPKEASSSTERKFVVGNPPVPENGPRNFPQQAVLDKINRKFVVGDPNSFVSVLPQNPAQDTEYVGNLDSFVPVSSAVVPQSGPRHFPQKSHERTPTDSDNINRKFLVGDPDSFVPISSAVVHPNGPRNFPQKAQEPTSDGFTPIPSAVLPQNEQRYQPEKDERKFVVGSIPSGYNPGEPMGVLEHGPRSIRLRRNAPEVTSSLPKDQENEVTSYKEKFNKYKLTKYAEINALNASKRNVSTSTTSSTTSTSTEGVPTEKNETTTAVYQEPNNIFTFLRNVFEMKVRIGLNFLLNTTDTFSRYLKGVQKRVEHVIKENRERFKKQY